ncbi:MAG: sigma 54-interacting transcriptional regulator [Thermoanaerobaculia bacterium]|nr:sigma 54-interacting transcriptional regulator [Thermoanaerobaculia bacterium]
MSYRLIFHHAGRSRKHDLGATTLVGSGPEADLLLVDPGVSRRHARVLIEGDRVTVEDLGSLNGTEVDERRTLPGEMRQAQTGSLLRFGPVEATLDWVAPEDMQVAVGFAPGLVTSDESGNHTRTVGAAELHRFVFHRLPDLLNRLLDRPGVGAVAGVVGESVLTAVPALGLSIETEEGGLLYTAGHLDAGVTVLARGRSVRVEASFADPAQGETFRPLLECGVSLVELGGRDPDPQSQRGAAPVALDPPTQSTRLRKIYEDAERIARGDVSVLILGESGTGKELLARYLHSASGRQGEFVALNAAALPQDLLEAELFGVERGVATGVDARPGKLETADGGTLFLDEIGDMPVAIQAKLLRALENGELVRVGARTTRHVDVRVLSASNRDLDELRRGGHFRDDLYHRIADWRVGMPPLRERRADIPNLAAHFLWRRALKDGVRPAGIARSAAEALTAYRWPGNVRQLEREMARVALFLEDGQLLERSHLSSEIRQRSGAGAGGVETLEELLERTERVAVQAALQESVGDTAAAAERLGVSRSTLYRRMAKHGLEVG